MSFRRKNSALWDRGVSVSMLIRGRLTRCTCSRWPGGSGLLVFLLESKGLPGPACSPLLWEPNPWCRARDGQVLIPSEGTWPAQGNWEMTQISCPTLEQSFDLNISILTFWFSDVTADVHILTLSSNGHRCPCGHFGGSFFLDSPIYRHFLCFYGAIPCFSQLAETNVFLLFSYGRMTAKIAHWAVSFTS